MSGQRRLDVLARHLAGGPSSPEPELARASTSGSSSIPDSSSWFKGRVVIITGA
jgi:hypothetical protein